MTGITFIFLFIQDICHSNLLCHYHNTVRATVCDTRHSQLDVLCVLRILSIISLCCLKFFTSDSKKMTTTNGNNTNNKVTTTTTKAT